MSLSITFYSVTFRDFSVQIFDKHVKKGDKTIFKSIEV